MSRSGDYGEVLKQVKGLWAVTQEEWLIQYITSAFAGVTLGDGIDIYAAMSQDAYGDAVEDRLSETADRKDWRLTPQDDLYPRFWAIGYLDAAGFRFYTPAIMIAVIEHPDHDYCLSSWFLMFLQFSETGATHGIPFNSLFTSRQRAAMVRYLKYRAFNRCPWTGDAETAREVLRQIQDANRRRE